MKAVESRRVYRIQYGKPTQPSRTGYDGPTGLRFLGYNIVYTVDYTSVT